MAADFATLIREADGAASRGDIAQARTLLERVVAARPDDLESRIKLAAVCRASGDMSAALAVTDAMLALDPLHFVGLLLRASLLEKLGSPEAGEAYGRALAQRPPGALAPAIASTVHHAEGRYAEHQQSLDHKLAAAVSRAAASASSDEKARLVRFRSNATRTTRVYHSEPSDYHFPGLIEREFHDRATFEWLGALESETDAIADELAIVMAAERRELVPYVQYTEQQPVKQWAALNNSLDWSAIHLIRNGAVVDANARHCPRTMARLSSLPLPHIPGVSPNAMFSLLAPGAHIPPHTGVANTRLVCHLPLVVPGGCWFRVGAERRAWKRGSAWVFDDTIEHEAANESTALRAILILDIWHPGLSETERAGVAALIGEHDRQGAHSL